MRREPGIGSRLLDYVTEESPEALVIEKERQNTEILRYTQNDSFCLGSVAAFLCGFDLLSSSPAYGRARPAVAAAGTSISLPEWTS